VSIIVPTNGTSDEKESAPSEIEHAIEQAEEKLLGKYGEEKVTFLLQKLRSVPGGIDSLDSAAGLGVFLSRDVYKIFKFPFTVKEKVIVADEFETRDLIYSTKSVFDYYFLLLSRKKTRLFKGCGGLLDEIQDEDFPKVFANVFEFPATKHTGTEANAPGSKSEQEDMHLKTYIKDIDYFLFLYLKDRHTPLIIAGCPEDLTYFKSITGYYSNLIGASEGNFDNSSLHDLQRAAISELNKFISNNAEQVAVEFEKNIKNKMAVFDIFNVWKQVSRHNCSVLLVEKDYSQDAFYAEDGSGILIENKKEKPLKKLDDAVNTIIEMAIQCECDIVFVENGRLSKYGRIGVMLQKKA